MRKKNKILTLISVFLIVFVLFTYVAFASSYNTWFSFDSTLKGQTRYFDGNNISFSATAISSPSPHNVNTTYTVKLYRDNLLVDDYIGSVTMDRDTYSVAQWSNVGSGNYYVRLSKAIDGIYLNAGSSSDQTVRFKNY